MRRTYLLGLVGKSEPAWQQSLYFLLTAFRFKPQLFELPAKEAAPNIKLWLAVNQLSKAEYDYLYHQQNLPTLFWGVNPIPRQRPNHIYHTPLKSNGSELITLLDEIIQKTTPELDSDINSFVNQNNLLTLNHFDNS